MGIIENAKDVAALVKGIGDMDLYKKILALEMEIMELTRDKARSDGRIEELERMLHFKENLTFDAPFYWRAGDKAPYCPGCWDERHKAVRVVVRVENDNGVWFDCPVCKHEYRMRPIPWQNLQNEHR
jgi:hypothetical protein